MVTAKLICVFVFAYAKIRFSHAAAHFKVISAQFYRRPKNQGHVFNVKIVFQFFPSSIIKLFFIAKISIFLISFPLWFTKVFQRDKTCGSIPCRHFLLNLLILKVKLFFSLFLINPLHYVNICTHLTFTVFSKTADLPDKTDRFWKCPQIFYSLPDSMSGIKISRKLPRMYFLGDLINTDIHRLADFHCYKQV